jgi:hypothetical protein
VIFRNFAAASLSFRCGQQTTLSLRGEFGLTLFQSVKLGLEALRMVFHFSRPASDSSRSHQESDSSSTVDIAVMLFSLPLIRWPGVDGLTRL